MCALNYNFSLLSNAHIHYFILKLCLILNKLFQNVFAKIYIYIFFAAHTKSRTQPHRHTQISIKLNFLIFKKKINKRGKAPWTMKKHDFSYSKKL